MSGICVRCSSSAWTLRSIYEQKLEPQFLEWWQIRDGKLSVEAIDYDEALRELYAAWKLLYRSAGLFHQQRQRRTDNEATRKLREESQKLYREADERFKTAIKLNKAADEKRAARQRMKQEEVERRNREERKRYEDAGSRVIAELNLLDVEEEVENAWQETVFIVASSEPDPKTRATVLHNEQARHERHIKEIERRREELARKMLSIAMPGELDVLPSDSTSEQRRAERETQAREAECLRMQSELKRDSRFEAIWKDAPPVKKGERQCGSTLAEEKILYRKERTK